MLDVDALPDGLLAYACLYFGAIAAIAVWEGLAPRRELSRPLRRRWLANFAVTAIDTLLARSLLPFLSIGAAVFAAEHGLGLLRAVALPDAVAWAIAWLALDLGRYAQHRALHRFEPLWRLHRMHHTDADYDFTTGLRFHPIEALFTSALAVLLVLALGPSVAAVLGFELLVIVVSLFAHANVRVPRRVDRALRRFVVTPDLHRVHHSALGHEADSNFASVSPWWDRWLGTYCDRPSLGHRAMQLGVAEFSAPRHETLGWMLLNPWIGADGVEAQVANRRQT